MDRDFTKREKTPKGETEYEKIIIFQVDCVSENIIKILFFTFFINLHSRRGVIRKLCNTLFAHFSPFSHPCYKLLQSDLYTPPPTAYVT